MTKIAATHQMKQDKKAAEIARKFKTTIEELQAEKEATAKK